MSKNEKDEAKSALREIVETFIWATLIALLVRYFIVEGYYIPSNSMAPTLVPGERILVAKFFYRFFYPQRGDVVVFRYPVNKRKNLIKRVAGLPGETIRIESGSIIINGVPLQSEQFARPYFAFGFYGKGEHIIPADSFFVLGDNSHNSDDSRFWGYVPFQNILGRAFLIYWPPRSIQIIR